MIKTPVFIPLTKRADDNDNDDDDGLRVIRETIQTLTQYRNNQGMIVAYNAHQAEQLRQQCCSYLLTRTQHIDFFAVEVFSGPLTLQRFHQKQVDILIVACDNDNFSFVELFQRNLSVIGFVCNIPSPALFTRIIEQAIYPVDSNNSVVCYIYSAVGIHSNQSNWNAFRQERLIPTVL